MSNCAISSRRSSQLLRKTYMKLLVPLIMLTLFIVNPSWLVGWELRSVFEQTRRMIRVTWSCKGLGGWKHIVNGHLLVTTRVGHLMIVSRHAAWVCSERVGGAVDLRRESARRRRESTRWGGGRSGAPDPQSSPSYRPQMLLQSALGDLKSTAIYKVQLIPAAVQVQASSKTSPACYLADALALPWAHHCSTPASGEALQYGGDRSCQPP